MGNFPTIEFRCLCFETGVIDQLMRVRFGSQIALKVLQRCRESPVFNLTPWRNVHEPHTSIMSGFLNDRSRKSTPEFR
jgi:hypothetical protein